MGHASGSTPVATSTAALDHLTLIDLGALVNVTTTCAHWGSCEFPSVNFMVVDAGAGISATQKVAGMGGYAYIGGYTDANLTLRSSTGGVRRLGHIPSPGPMALHCLPPGMRMCVRMLCASW